MPDRQQLLKILILHITCYSIVAYVYIVYYPWL